MQLENVIEGISETPAPTPRLTRIRVWDLPLRIFHWSLMIAVLTAIITGLVGGSWMKIHSKAGLVIIGLLVFRVVWGFVGSTHARFINFIPSTKKMRAYFKGQWQRAGHNPLGAIFVFALLGLLSLQATTGLFANDEINFTGPLYGLIDDAFSLRLTGLHKQLSNVLLGLLALHVLAIAFYVWFKRDNLVKPMVTGWKEVPSGTSARNGGLVALIAAVLIAVSGVYVTSGAVFSEQQAAVPKDTRVPAW